MNNNILKRYMLLNIYLNKWKPGDKIPSSQQLSIKFNLSLSTVKKELAKFKKNNIITTNQRKGFFINESLFNYVPLSIRKKYGLISNGIKIKIQEKNTLLTKKYSFKKTELNIWVDSTIFSDVFKYSKYKESESFMYNLAWNGIIISKIENNYKIKDIDDAKYLVENRKLFDLKNTLVVNEKIYIPYEIWFAKDQFQF